MYIYIYIKDVIRNTDVASTKNILIECAAVLEIRRVEILKIRRIS